MTLRRSVRPLVSFLFLAALCLPFQPAGAQTATPCTAPVQPIPIPGGSLTLGGFYGESLDTSDEGVWRGLRLEWDFPESRSGIRWSLGTREGEAAADGGTGSAADTDIDFTDLGLQWRTPLSDRSSLSLHAGPGWARARARSPDLADIEDDGLTGHAGIGWRYRMGDRLSFGASVESHWFGLDLPGLDEPDYSGLFSVGYTFSGADIQLPPPPLRLVDFQPCLSGGLAKEHLVRRPQDTVDHVKVKPYLFLQNDGAASYRLTGVRLTYDLPDGFVGRPIEERFEEAVKIKRSGVTRVELLRRALVGDPSELTIELIFKKAPTIQVTIPLQEQLTTYPPPFKVEDLKSGEREHWYLSRWHKDEQSVEFGLDLVVIGYCEGQPTNLICKRKGNDAKEHRRVWGKPVYSISSGVVVRCSRSNPDLELDQDEDGTARINSIDVRAPDGDIINYSHLQKDSIPAEICTTGTPVLLGQRLGFVGNSGTNRPHLHIHIVKGIGRDFFSGEREKNYGYPLQFESGWAINITDRTREGLWPWIPLQGQAPWGAMALTASGCGNGVREGREICDGPDLGGESCSSLASADGKLACAFDCKSFDLSQCDRSNR